MVKHKLKLKNRLFGYFIFLFACCLTLTLILKFLPGNTRTTSSLIPKENEAKAIFTTLHRNLYDTFNEPDSNLAYDKLEKSVDSPLLEQVYKELFHYYTGKSTQEMSVEIVDVKIREFETLKNNSFAPASIGQFKIKAGWDVFSIVTHEGHWHPRTNNFKGVYTLSLIDGQWKITEDEILWQRRIPFDLSSFKTKSVT